MTEELLDALRRFADGAPSLSPQERRRINTAATLPDDFLEAVAHAMEARPRYGDIARLSTEEIHDTVAATNAREAVVEELERITRAMRDTIVTLRADVGQRALLVYALAKRSDDEEMAEHTERMRRKLRARK
ncbi:MAG TPA: hypothetical protein VF432_11455 [Thermoanaerobaculia bacterium]